MSAIAAELNREGGALARRTWPAHRHATHYGGRDEHHRVGKERRHHTGQTDRREREDRRRPDRREHRLRRHPVAGPKVWGEHPDQDNGVALLRGAVAEGVAFIDTADVYGPHSNEQLIREALHAHPEHVVVATKGGFVPGGPS
jgi:hypothetical protein